MEEKKKKIFIGTRFAIDTDDHGQLVDEEGNWKSGVVTIEAFTSNGGSLNTYRESMSRAKYKAFREDFDRLSTEKVMEKYFEGAESEEAKETEKSKELREAEARIAELEKQIKDGNVLPVGDKGVTKEKLPKKEKEQETPSNARQENVEPVKEPVKE